MTPCEPDHTDWCHTHERHHCPMDYSDGCDTDLDRQEAEANPGRMLARVRDQLLGRRCRARLPRSRAGGDGFYGRCELREHLPAMSHALERGMYFVRWRTDLNSDGGVTDTWITPDSALRLSLPHC